MSIFFIITGIIFLVFRLWLTEVKLFDDLGFKRRYISRIVNLYFWIAVIFSFKNIIFNIIVFASAPILVVTMIWDGAFYLQCMRRRESMNNLTWQVAERITLHIPVVMGGVYMVMNGAHNFVNAGSGYAPVLGALLLVIPPYVVLDERWKSSYNWPHGIVILLLIVVTISATALFMYNTP